MSFCKHLDTNSLLNIFQNKKNISYENVGELCNTHIYKQNNFPVSVTVVRQMIYIITLFLTWLSQDALSLVGDPLSGNGCGSPNYI